MTHDSTQHSSVWESTGWIQICRYEYCNWNSLLWLVPGTWTCFNWSTGGLQAEICPRVRTYRQSDTNSRYERALIFSRNFSKIFYWTMREIVHLQAGQCGNQIGAKVRLDDQLDCKVQLFKMRISLRERESLSLTTPNYGNSVFKGPAAKYRGGTVHHTQGKQGMAWLYCTVWTGAVALFHHLLHKTHDTPRPRENLLT